jgi:intracellular sulfur oxidation DsrE/DsrF family protein
MGIGRFAWLASCALLAALAASAHDGDKQRVVIQVSDDNPKTWSQALNVARNLREAYGRDGLDVEIVAFGNGIGMLTMDSVVGNRVKDALADGAAVYACENTMRGRQLHKEDMLPSIGYASSGAVEIVTKNKQGWVVIRP